MKGLRGWWVLVVAVGLIASVGCQDQVAKRDFDALKVHNDKLMTENTQLQAEFEEFKSQQFEAAAAPAAAPMPAPMPAPATRTADLETIRRQLPSGASVDMRGSQPVIRIDGVLVCSGANRAEVSADGQRILDRVAVLLNTEFAGSQINIEGHTDTDPIKRLARYYKNNWELGFRRAQSVVDYLVSRGVDPKRLRAASFGEHHPISTNKAENRRVEIVVGSGGIGGMAASNFAP